MGVWCGRRLYTVTTMSAWHCSALGRSAAQVRMLVGPNQCGNVCPARTGPLKGPKCSLAYLAYLDLPYLANCLVKIAIVRQNCAKLGKSQGWQPNFSPTVVACAQGRHSHSGSETLVASRGNGGGGGGGFKSPIS